MATRIEHLHTTWQDISDYAVSFGKIPFNPVNRDYSLQAQTWEVVIAETLRDKYADPTFDFIADDQLRVYDDNDVLIFSGYVDKSVFDYRTMAFNVTVKTSIMSLEKIKVDYSTLHTRLITGANWWEYTAQSFFYNMPIVGVIWTLKKIFEAGGLTLDTTAVDDVTLFTRIASGDQFNPDVIVKYKDLYFYEDILYCINQSVSVKHTIIDVRLDFASSKISCFQFVSSICSYLRLAVRLTGISDYKLISLTSNYTTASTGSDITDDNKFEYSLEKIRAEDVTVSAGGMIFIEANLPNYLQEPLTGEEIAIQQSSGGGGTIINTLKGMAMFFSDAKNKTNHYEDEHAYVVCSNIASVDFAIDDGETGATLNLISLLVREKISNYLQEVVTTNSLTQEKTILRNDIDLEWSNSEITQETF